MSSPHKCGQESDYSSFNTAVAAFPQIFWAFPPSFQIHRIRPPLQSILEGSSSSWNANLRFASHVREDFHPQTPLHVPLTCGALRQTFIMYWQSPRTICCPHIGPWPNILIWVPTPTQVTFNSRFNLVHLVNFLSFHKTLEPYLKKKSI